MRTANTIVFASGNRHKFQEVSFLLKSYPDLKLVMASQVLKNAGKIGLVENFETYSENAAAKARLTNQGTHYPSLADDSGLEVQALEGKPGVRTHRFAIPKAGETQDSANMNKLLKELEGVPTEKRVARFVCSMALVMEGICVFGEGVLNGIITESPRGTGGFGYDPIFIPDGYQQTLAEISEEEKNKISHRALALHDLMKNIETKGLTFTKP